MRLYIFRCAISFFTTSRYGNPFVIYSVSKWVLVLRHTSPPLRYRVQGSGTQYVVILLPPFVVFSVSRWFLVHGCPFVVYSVGKWSLVQKAYMVHPL